MKQTEHIVDRQWLREQLNNPQVVIVDCRFQLGDSGWGKKVYHQSHIPSAYYLDLNSDLSSQVELHGGRHPLPDSSILANKLTQMGIVQNETLVVAYDDARFAFASRLWWLLRYLGHDKVVLLDGGWNGWVEDNYPVSQDIPADKSGKFIPQANLDCLVDIDAVRSAQNEDKIVVVDSRDRDRCLDARTCGKAPLSCALRRRGVASLFRIKRTYRSRCGEYSWGNKFTLETS